MIRTLLLGLVLFIGGCTASMATLFVNKEMHSQEELRSVPMGWPFAFVKQDLSGYTPMEWPQKFRFVQPQDNPASLHVGWWAADVLFYMAIFWFGFKALGSVKAATQRTLLRSNAPHDGQPLHQADKQRWASWYRSGRSVCAVVCRACRTLESEIEALIPTSVLQRLAIAALVLALSLYGVMGAALAAGAGGARVAVALLAFTLALLLSGAIVVIAKRPYASTFIGRWAMRVFGALLCILVAAFVFIQVVAFAFAVLNSWVPLVASAGTPLHTSL